MSNIVWKSIRVASSILDVAASMQRREVVTVRGRIKGVLATHDGAGDGASSTGYTPDAELDSSKWEEPECQECGAFLPAFPHNDGCSKK